MTRPGSRWREQHGGDSSLTPLSTAIDNHRRARSPLHPSPGTQDVFDTIVKGRKSWKTLRGGEVVWPPELEAALLEGLESYQPDDSRETRLLGRFPLRNRFISDYILEKTGKHRTPKQVGSRLQQLRDTCGGKELLSLLSPCRIPGRPPSNQLYHRSSSLHSDSSDGSSSGPNSPTEHAASPWNNNAGGTSTSVICIDILPDNPSYPSSPVSPQFPFGYSLPHPANDIHPDEIKVSQQPRPIRSIDPTLSFISHTSIEASSLFNVSINGHNVHTELVPLALRAPSQTIPSSDTAGAFVYSTSLVPSYWRTIVESEDPTKYTIHQEVFKETPSGSCPIYSGVFKFKFSYPAGSNSRIQPSPPFAGVPAPAHLGSVPEHFFLDGVGGTSVNMSGMMDCPKPSVYNFNSFDGWDMSQLSPVSDTGSTAAQSFRSHSSRGYSTSRSNSISPTVANFPSNIYYGP